MEGLRDCHLKPDLILIYEKPDSETLRLIRLGSYSDLGL
jgi:mRNA interferase YafQ